MGCVGAVNKRDNILNEKLMNLMSNLLSGLPNTMQQILAIINIIATPNFLGKAQFLNNSDNRNTIAYRQQLLEWNLFSELRLVDNDADIRKQIIGNSSFTRNYNKNIFENGSYNKDRYTLLNSLLPVLC